MSPSDDVRLEIEAFANDAPRRIRSLQARLAKRTFRFAKAKGLAIEKRDSKGKKTGKIRPIVLAPVESRIVQRALLNVLLDVPTLKPFAHTPYSFGGIRSERRRGDERQHRAAAVSAVPAAIKAVLEAIGRGGRFVACADISGFFTKVPKAYVLEIISSAVEDEEFVAFLEKAIEVELSNLAALRELSSEFPTESLGVAQGNSLSPLLGNICLAEFDGVMNEGDCSCIRYIDDFIIVAPTLSAANARLRKAKALLGALGMELSSEKSHLGGVSIASGFTFLGISIVPGLIRPSAKAQVKFLASLDKLVAGARSAFRGTLNGQPLAHSQALIATLRRIDGMVDGWGKHYWFCNDTQTMANLDRAVSLRLREVLGSYSEVRRGLAEGQRGILLGVSQLASAEREPFTYPSVT